jgi:hypothetical protein
MGRIMKLNYTDVLAKYYPNLKFISFGDGTDYSKLIINTNQVLPPKEDLDAKLLTLRRDVMWRKIQVERDRRKHEGGYKVGTDWFHSDDTSRIQQIALTMMGAAMPTGILWKTMANTMIPMTPTLAQQIFQAAVASDAALFAVAEQHRLAMLQLDNPETYNYLTGTPAWPKVYGE